MPQNIHPLNLSVIIVNRNTSSLLRDCLTKFLQSDLEIPSQIIVVDNGSTDNSIEMIRTDFPDVTLIEAGRNLGFAAANNRGFSMSVGEFILLLNTDAMVEKDCISTMLALAISDDQIALVGPQLLNSDGTKQTSFEATPTLLTETTNRSLLKRLFPKRYPGKTENLANPKDVETLIGAVMLVRRKAFDAVGGFDPGYFFFFEETDLAVRLRRAGWRVVHEPRAKAVHLQGGSAKSHPAPARIEFYRSRYIFFEKLYGKVAKNFLKSVIMVNVTLNVFVYGIFNVLTLGQAKSVRQKFQVRRALCAWHFRGCPDGYGLPRD